MPNTACSLKRRNSSERIGASPRGAQCGIICKLIGSSPLSVDELSSAIARGKDPSRLPGDFVFIEEDTSRGYVRFSSSAVAAIPYYYAIDAKAERLVHAANVFSCHKKLGGEWEWNARAVVSLALFQHTLSDDTLHAKIKRIPAASTMQFDRGVLRTATSTPQAIIDEDRGSADGDHILHQAARDLQRIVAEFVTEAPPLISLSAGFDSRLLLALAISAGVAPALATMGDSESTDVRIARKIANAFGLRHQQVVLNPADYLTQAARVTELTSGTKTAEHWHTYLFSRAVSPSGFVHLAGANGEFARTYYFDKGILALSSRFLPSYLSSSLLRIKNSRRRRVPVAVHSGILADPQHLRSVHRLTVSCINPRLNWLDALDEFYCMQRVRHFIGNGLALYNANMPTRSPFLDYRFLQVCRRIPRQLKLGSVLHRLMIRETCPGLLKYPVDDGTAAMSDSPRKLYWLRRYKVHGYSRFSEFAARKDVREIVVESKLLDAFADRASRQAACSRNNESLISLFLTLHFAAEAARHATEMAQPHTLEQS